MLLLNYLKQPTDVEKHAVHTRFVSKLAFNARINSPSPFYFLYSTFKSTVFSPTEEASTFNREKEEHCEYHGL